MFMIGHSLGRVGDKVAGPKLVAASNDTGLHLYAFGDGHHFFGWHGSNRGRGSTVGIIPVGIKPVRIAIRIMRRVELWHIDKLLNDGCVHKTRQARPWVVALLLVHDEVPDLHGQQRFRDLVARHVRDVPCKIFLVALVPHLWLGLAIEPTERVVVTKTGLE